MQRAAAVHGDVAGVGGQRDTWEIEVVPQVDLLHVGTVRPGTTPSSPLSWSAPVTEMPDGHAAAAAEWPPSEQSLCHDTSEMPSTTPVFLSRPSELSPSWIALHHRVVGERADGAEAIGVEQLAQRR